VRPYSIHSNEREAYYRHLDSDINARDILETAMDQGRAEGLEKGREEGKLSVAKNMKSIGVEASVISQCTGLTIDEISAL